MAARVKSVRRGIVLSPYPLNVTGGSRSVKQKVVSECHSTPTSAAAASQKITKKAANHIVVAITSSIISLVVILLPFRDKRACWLLSFGQYGDQHQNESEQPQR